MLSHIVVLSIRRCWENPGAKRYDDSQPLVPQTCWIDANVGAKLAPSIAKTAMGRLANPQEVADTIVFLSSERSSYMTGSVLTVSCPCAAIECIHA